MRAIHRHASVGWTLDGARQGRRAWGGRGRRRWRRRWRWRRWWWRWRRWWWRRWRWWWWRRWRGRRRWWWRVDRVSRTTRADRRPCWIMEGDDYNVRAGGVLAGRWHQGWAQACVVLTVLQVARNCRRPERFVLIRIPIEIERVWRGLLAAIGLERGTRCERIGCETGGRRNGDSCDDQCERVDSDDPDPADASKQEAEQNASSPTRPSVQISRTAMASHSEINAEAGRLGRAAHITDSLCVRIV